MHESKRKLKAKGFTFSNGICGPVIIKYPKMVIKLRTFALVKNSIYMEIKLF